MKRVIFLSGLQGCGKSYLASQIFGALSFIGKRPIVLSRDKHRIVNGEYIFDLDREDEVLEKYLVELGEMMKSDLYDTLILDGTHYANFVIDRSLEVLRSTNVPFEYLFVILIPSPLKDLNFYIQNNKHGVSPDEMKMSTIVWAYWYNDKAQKEWSKHSIEKVGLPYVEPDEVMPDIFRFFEVENPEEKSQAFFECCPCY